MKYNLASFFLMLLLTIPALAQKNEKGDEEQTIKRKNVPKAVLTAFSKAYPTAKIKGYSREKDGEKVVYEIESVEGKVTRDVLYDSDGMNISIEESCPYGDVPEAVRSTISKEYPGAKVSQCEKLMKGSSTQYELQLKSGKKRIEVVLDPDGKVAEKEVE